MLPASTAKAEAARAASLHGAEAEACPGTLLPPQPPPAWPGPLSFAPWPCVCTLVHPAGSCHLQPASQCMRKLRGSWPWPRAVLQPVPHHSSMCPLPHGPAWGHTSAGVQAAVSQTTLVVAVHLGALGWWRAPWRRGARGAALLQTSCGPGLKLNACPLTPLCGGMMFALQQTAQHLITCALPPPLEHGHGTARSAWAHSKPQASAAGPTLHMHCRHANGALEPQQAWLRAAGWSPQQPTCAPLAPPPCAGRRA